MTPYNPPPNWTQLSIPRRCSKYRFQYLLSMSMNHHILTTKWSNAAQLNHSGRMGIFSRNGSPRKSINLALFLLLSPKLHHSMAVPSFTPPPPSLTLQASSSRQGRITSLMPRHVDAINESFPSRFSLFFVHFLGPQTQPQVQERIKCTRRVFFPFPNLQLNQQLLLLNFSLIHHHKRSEHLPVLPSFQ